MKRRTNRNVIAFMCAITTLATSALSNTFICRAADVNTSNGSNAAVIGTTHKLAPNRGDVNGDGKIDAADASEALHMYAENSTTTGGIMYSYQADMDGDKSVDAADASIILSVYAELSTLKTPESYLRQEILYSKECVAYYSLEDFDLYFGIKQFEVFFVLNESEGWAKIETASGQTGYIKRIAAYDTDVISRNPAIMSPISTTKSTSVTAATTSTTTATTTKSTSTATTTVATATPISSIKYYAYLDNGEPWKIRSTCELISKENPNNNIVGQIGHNEVFEVFDEATTDWYSIRKYNDDGTTSFGYVYMSSELSSSFAEITKTQYDDVVFRGIVIDFSRNTTQTTTSTTTKTVTTTVPTTTTVTTTTTNANTSDSIYLMYRSDGIPWKIRALCDVSSDIVGTIAFDEVVELKKPVGNNWYLCEKYNNNGTISNGYILMYDNEEDSAWKYFLKITKQEYLSYVNGGTRTTTIATTTNVITTTTVTTATANTKPDRYSYKEKLTCETWPLWPTPEESGVSDKLVYGEKYFLRKYENGWFEVTTVTGKKGYLIKLPGYSSKVLDDNTFPENGPGLEPPIFISKNQLENEGWCVWDEMEIGVTPVTYLSKGMEFYALIKYDDGWWKITNLDRSISGYISTASPEFKAKELRGTKDWDEYMHSIGR